MHKRLWITHCFGNNQFHSKVWKLKTYMIEYGSLYSYKVAAMSLKSRNIDLKSISKYWMSMNAIVSILHRISGVILFLLIPFMVWLLDHSLANENSFLSLMGLFDGFCVRLLIWVLLSALIYHLMAGIKHLLMDMGWMESIKGSYWSSLVVFSISFVIILALGVRILW